MKIELTGKVIKVGAVQEFASGFKKREIVLEIESGEYPNCVPVEAIKDKCEYLDKYKPGDMVECSAFLNGSYYEKGDRYFLALRLSYIKAVEGGSQSANQPAGPASAGDESEDLPPF